MMMTIHVSGICSHAQVVRTVVLLEVLVTNKLKGGRQQIFQPIANSNNNLRARPPSIAIIIIVLLATTVAPAGSTTVPPPPAGDEEEGGGGSRREDEEAEGEATAPAPAGVAGAYTSARSSTAYCCTTSDDCSGAGRHQPAGRPAPTTACTVVRARFVLGTGWQCGPAFCLRKKVLAVVVTAADPP